MILPCLLVMCGTIFALIPANTVGGVAAVAAVYGFVWGACKFRSIASQSQLTKCLRLRVEDAALTPAALASLAKSNEEVGYEKHIIGEV